jgi:aspartyl-tRNA(Asn)/glutamyl-tRNA(Gln) amidotransferase subunit A
MTHVLDQPLAEVARALRARRVSAVELAEAALDRIDRFDAALHAYKHVDRERTMEDARGADGMLSGQAEPPPFCGIPISVKDLYGVAGFPTFAGTSRRLPERWSRDAWLVARLRAQGAVVVGKTHTVELAYGALGINPHWGTPRNPWDAEVHRIPGGSSCGAGVSLLEGSALVALGTDTGGSIRIPAAMTGTVGHKTTFGRWSVDGVVPHSSTHDSVGGLTRTVADAAWFFGAVDPAWGDPAALLASVAPAAPPAVGIPRCALWDDCAPDVARVLRSALDELAAAGWRIAETEGSLVDEATHLYLGGGIAGAECRAFLARELPEWPAILHPTVGSRLEKAEPLTSTVYASAMARRWTMVARAPALYDGADVLALPTCIVTPPPVAELEALPRYLDANVAALRPTCPISILGGCAVTLPVGRDRAGMPVGLQLVGPGGADEALLGLAMAAERVLGTCAERLGVPPLGVRSS